MAEKHHSHSHDHASPTESPFGQSAPGTMDISDHIKTWLGFWNSAKWGAIGIIAIVVFLAFFRTHNGY
jgi:hypothetical protein